ncbi:MAG: hypothetical protein RR881_01535 [Malacoplasma sp.]
MTNNYNKNSNPSTGNSPWYKKKSTIIAISSTLGVGVLATAIAVPVALTSNNTNNISDNIASNVNIKNVYDLTTKNVRLVLTSEDNDLPTTMNDYKVFSNSSKSARAQINSKDIALVQIGTKQIQLKFNDHSLTDSTKYQVVIKDSKPIETKENVLQPAININTEPTHEVVISSTETNKIVTLSIAASIKNPIDNQVTPNYQWYSSSVSNAGSDMSRWDLIEGARSSEYPYDSTSLSLDSKMYFRCVLSYKYTDIKLSSIAYVEKRATAPGGPTAEQIKAAVDTFNAKPLTDKMSAYNSMTENDTNNTNIKDYFMKQGGMSRFLNMNAKQLTGNELSVFKIFQAFLTTYNTTTISSTQPVFTPTNGKPFMNIKGVKEGADNMNATSTYVSHDLSKINNTAFSTYNFYSPISTSISEITINNDFSINMTVTSSEVSNNFMFKIVNAVGGKTYDINYNGTIKFNNSTLFPGMSEYVRRTILKI